MNPVELVRSLNKVSRRAHDTEVRLVRLLVGPLAKAFPEIRPKDVSDLWRSLANEGLFKREVEKGAVRGLPDWLRVDDHAPVDSSELLGRPLEIKAVADMLARVEGGAWPAQAVVFRVARRGEWVAHNLAHDRHPGTVRVDVALADDHRLIIQTIEDFIKERIKSTLP